MKIAMLALATLALTTQLTHAAPSKDPQDLTGMWTLEERSSDDPVRVLNGERGRGGRTFNVTAGGSIFGVPVGGAPRSERNTDRDEGKATDGLGGVEHVFEATYRLRFRRSGAVTEIRYGNEPTITYYDGDKVERNGATARVKWDGGTLTIEHELADGGRVSERYWVETRSGELHWTASLVRRKGSADVERLFYRSPAGEQ